MKTPKPLTIEDMDREELLLIARLVAEVAPQFVTQRDLWLCRWRVLQDRTSAAMERFVEASRQSAAALEASVDAATPRRGRAYRRWTEAADARDRAWRRYRRLSRAAEAAWARYEALRPIETGE